MTTCPAIPQCCNTDIYLYRIPEVFENNPLTLSCPGGSTGGPFSVIQGQFTSLISQADADAKAVAFLDNLISSQCVLQTRQFSITYPGFDTTQDPPIPNPSLEINLDGNGFIPWVAGNVYEASGKIQTRLTFGPITIDNDAGDGFEMNPQVTPLVAFDGGFYSGGGVKELLEVTCASSTATPGAGNLSVVVSGCFGELAVSPDSGNCPLDQTASFQSSGGAPTPNVPLGVSSEWGVAESVNGTASYGIIVLLYTLTF